MSGGEKIRAEQYAKRLALTKKFEDGDCMFPAFMHEGHMRWATYYSAETNLNRWEVEKRWKDTNIALLGVHLAVIKRQDEIDKKLYAQDETLENLRNRARAIGQARIELCAVRLKIEKAEKRIDSYVLRFGRPMEELKREFEAMFGPIDSLGLDPNINVAEVLK